MYLSGGTALAAYYLHHRRSDDLDLFTRADHVGPLETRVVQAATAAGLEIARVDRHEQAMKFSLSGDPDHERPLERVDVASDPPPYFAEPAVFDGIPVDSLLAIAVNKVAIVTRHELKDYVDLFFILRETPLRLEDLIPLAKEKLLGLDEWALIDKFLAARDVAGLAEFQARSLVRPIDWDDLQRFYADAADRLIALFPPRRDP